MHGESAPDTASAVLEDWSARYRAELTGYCYRMLGSPFEAEDAVQETLLRAWRRLDRFDERRAAPRGWLHAIATNVCLDLLRQRRRRALAVDLGPAASPGSPLGAPLPEDRWVLPAPDASVLPVGADPADIAAARETLRWAFVAALQYLPHRQRAVLLLREVLCWSAAEVAELLQTSTASVNSALQRARATLGARGVDAEPEPVDETRRELLARYCSAFERHDVAALVALLREDAAMAMPPFAWWLRGRDEIGRALAGSDWCRGSRLVPVAANGATAFAQYVPDGPGGRLRAWAVQVVEVHADRIAATTSFLAADRLFGLFGLPLEVSGAEAGALGGDAFSGGR